MHRTSHLRLRPCMPSSSSSSAAGAAAARRCGGRCRLPRSAQPWMQLLLLSLALFLLGAIDFALPRRCTSLFFVRAAGDAEVANAAAAPPLLAITETALISVDFGQESMKVSAWRAQQQAPRIGMAEGGDAATATSTGSVTMVLNDQANRKSPPCVAFRYVRDPAATAGRGGVSTDAGPSGRADGEQLPAHHPYTALHPRGYQLERTFAEQAQALAPRFPEQVVCSAAQLLGCAAAPTNAAVVESRACALTSGQLTTTTTYSYHVVPLTAPLSAGTTTGNSMDEAQQRRDNVVGRQALGVYVPFFTTSNAPGQQWRWAAGDHSTGVAAAAAEEEAGVLFSSEELTAMLLGHARRMAEQMDAADNTLSEEDERLLAGMRKSARRVDAAAGATRASSAIRYAALTVPAHASVAQRQALVDAAALAGLRVVRLVHSTTGAAVQLAYLKAEQVLTADRVSYVMIYDMGSQHAEVAIYSLAAPPASVASRARLRGDVVMQALVGSRTLGGAAFDECIANHWDARYFGRRVMNGGLAAAGGRDAARREAARERGSLLRAAQRAKEMLSANNDAHVTIDGVRAEPSQFDAVGRQELQQRHVAVTADGGLLSLRLTRRDFEEWCRPLFDAAVALRDEAIAATGGGVKSLGALDRFEVIGGGTRVPRLLQRLGEGYRSGVVDRTLNSDEAAVMGTTLLAVSSAPRTLGLRLGQALPRYHVREWLTSAVYASMELHSTGTVAAAAAPSEVQLLFAARKTTLPATRSVRVRLPDVDVSPADNVVITLYSGAEADSAYAHSTRSDAAVAADSARAAASPTLMANCTSCYVRTCTVEGVRKAAEQLLAPYTQQKTQHGSARPRRERVRLAGAEVVVEVVATVSGIPHCSIAYLRAEVEEAGVDPNAAEGIQGSNAAAGAATVASLPNSDHDGTAAGVPPATQHDEPSEGVRDEHEMNANEEEVKHTGARVTPKGTADPATVDATATPPPQWQVRVIALSLRVSSGAATAAAAVHGLGYNMDFAELTFSHRRVRQLQALDDVRLRRSTLRNEIESVLVWIKEHHPTWDAEDVQDDASPSSLALRTWRTTVREVGGWLDDVGDTASATALEERLRIIAGVKAALREAA
ncbi:HSP70-like protein [Leishmania major strain Friedlin]|uniref:HSP70-like protein n=1 Tax=Leishmania major TaxID=5664 RepID=E9AC55_LEIMA|nr:HSP70-like protein [Leishmania major strain Friedlin]CAG9567129.1 HSP70.a [Leishmania major strain Friedlin]CBZ11869.1 HSP70-like protein [Leishmania major strain Friedlin]|eukprot:XP_003721586.1 HSP70-like protein [Leishmania major strain Friedlin]